MTQINLKEKGRMTPGLFIASILLAPFFFAWIAISTAAAYLKHRRKS